MTHTLFAKKQTMTEAYLGDARVAVTKLDLYETTILKEKVAEKDGYNAQVVSFAPTRRKPYIREVAPSESIALTVGTLVHVQSTSKGKGTAGVVKKWGFAGGPRTHGQSDRLRRPGSIGQGTTPGRVLRGKHMAGRMGNAKVTVKNLPIVAYDEANKQLWIAGSIPGRVGALVTLTVTDQTCKLGELKYLKGYSPVSSNTRPEADQPMAEAN